MLYLDDPIGKEVPPAYDEGYSAYFNGAEIDQNPYDGNDKLQWYHGWHDACLVDTKNSIVTFSTED